MTDRMIALDDRFIKKQGRELEQTKSNLDAVGKRPRKGRPWTERKVSWKCFTIVILVCICNFIVTVAVLVALLLLRQEVTSLRVHCTQPVSRNIVHEHVTSSTSPAVEHPAASSIQQFIASENHHGESVKKAKRVTRSSAKKSCKDCDCSSKKKGKTCRKCCKRKVKRREERKRAFELVNKFRPRFKNLQNKFAALNESVLRMLEDQRHDFANFHDKLHLSHLGHFEGDNNQKPECNNERVGRQRVKTTPSGMLCLWRPANWMTDDAKELYQLDKHGKVRVNESGVYFIYGQLVQADVIEDVSARVRVLSTGKVRTLATCVETAGQKTVTEALTSVVTKVETLRTCYLGVLAQLQAGDQVYLSLDANDKPIETFHSADTAYFGFVKFA